MHQGFGSTSPSGERTNSGSKLSGLVDSVSLIALWPLPSHSGVMASWLTRTPLPPEAVNGGLTVPVDFPEGGWPPCQKTSKRDPPEPAPPQPTIHRRTTNHRGLRAFASAIWGQPVGDRRQVRLRPFGLVALGSEAWP